MNKLIYFTVLLLLVIYFIKKQTNEDFTQKEKQAPIYIKQQYDFYNGPNMNDIVNFNIDPILTDSANKILPGYDFAVNDIYKEQQMEYNKEAVLRSKVESEFKQNIIKTTGRVISSRMKDKQIPLTITDSNKNFDYMGIAYNKYYTQYYIIYERYVENKNDKSGKLFEYRLVKLDKNKKPEVVHQFGPRSKVNLEDVVYFSYGTFQLGPLLVTNFG
jgi:hypothetical protein